MTLPPGKWAAIVAILLLQGYLVLAPNSHAPTDETLPTGARIGQLTP